MQGFTQDDIDKYIKFQAEESINLEFKSGDALNGEPKTKLEIAKDVSSFANSDGGLIIYGIKEINNKASELVFVDGNKFTKEWLEQVINSNIQRKIDGLTIYPIRYDNIIENTIYVIKIPRSLSSPHMTSDKRFYKRYNFTSVQMEEYEVRNLYNRKEKTSLEIIIPKFKLESGGTSGGKPIDFGWRITIQIKNIGTTIEKHYKLEIQIPSSLTTHVLYDPKLKDNLDRNQDGYSIYVIPNNNPLFQDEVTSLLSFKLGLNFNNFDDIKIKPLVIRLLYSNGVDIKSFMLSEYLNYNGKEVTKEILFL